MGDLLQPGQLFAGRYRVERFLARGGCGAVFAAEQVNTETPVAAKVLWPHLVDSADFAERFKLEARVAGRILSDHMVRVLDTGYDEETGLAFLVMSLLDGISLQGLVEKQGPLEPEWVADFVMQVASGFNKAHRYEDEGGNPRPIVHRDLKPENLFVTRRDNGAALIKIQDLGIAKLASNLAAVTAKAPGYATWKTGTDVGRTGDVQEVLVPRLDPVVSPAPSVAPAARPVEPSGPRPGRASASEGISTSRIVLGGLGAAALVAVGVVSLGAATDFDILNTTKEPSRAAPGNARARNVSVGLAGRF